MAGESRLARVLMKELNDRIIHQSESIAAGGAPDFMAYRDVTGYIRGLKEALRLCEEIDRGIE